MSHARPDPRPGDVGGGATPPQPWASREAPTPPWGDTARPGRGARPRPPGGAGRGRPTPPSGFAATPAPGFATAGTPRAHRRDRLARPRQRLVALARVLAGGLVVLAVVVIAAPAVLGGPGPGTDTIVGHLVGAVLAVGATAVAAHRRAPSGPALAAAAAVPVILCVVLWTFWWA